MSNRIREISQRLTVALSEREAMEHEMTEEQICFAYSGSREFAISRGIPARFIDLREEILSLTSEWCELNVTQWRKCGELLSMQYAARIYNSNLDHA